MVLNWNDIEIEDEFSYLLGNGFSIQISTDFLYGKLSEKANLTEDSKKIFTELKEVNFEAIIKYLNHFKNISENIFNLDPTKAIACSENIRQGLISAVGTIHPDYNTTLEDRLKNTITAIGDARHVFTTNYDLLLYWIHLINKDIKDNGIVTKDLFWNTFEYGDDFSDLRDGEVGIHYLHGGLHIFPKRFSGAEKLSTGSRHTHSETIKEEIEKSHYPLFIAEGNSENKMEMIEANNYLSYCYRKLKTSKEAIVFHGHSLNLDFDEHIIDAVGESYTRFRKNKVYISVFDRDSRTEALNALAFQLKESIKRYFPRDTEFIFYDANTHPFAV